MKQMLFAFMCMFIIPCVAQLSSYTIGGTTYTNAYDNDVNVNATSYTMGGITHIHGTVDGAPISTSSYSLGGGLTHTSCSAGGTSYSLGRSSYSKNYHYRDRVATSTTDIFGNTSTIFSNGTTASSLTDIFGNTATIFSDGTTVNSSTDIFWEYDDLVTEVNMAVTNNRGCLSNLLWAIPFALLAGLISKGMRNLNMIHPAASTSSYGSSVVDGTTASKTAQYSSSVPVGKKMTFTKLLERSPRPTQAELIRTLEAGADPNEHILFPPAQFEKMKQMMTMIATSVGRSSNEPITRENFFNTPLTLAASMEGMTFFNELMKRGADPNIKLHPLGTPPLQIAISRQKLEMVKALLDHGADPEQLSYMGNAVSAAVVS